MKVILAGYSKTGTKSMCSALSLLGYNTYDFLEHWHYHSKEWMKIFKNGGTVEDFQKMYEHVDAVTDAPAFYFWEEIHQAFPDAKIVFTTRDEDSWYKSFKKQKKFEAPLLLKLQFIAVFTCFNPIKIIKFQRFFELLLKVICGSQTEPTENELVDRMRFRRHNAYVLQAAPKDKLLVYNVSEGWEPLCKFLGVDIPNQPFPRKNIGSTLAQELIAENPIAIENLRKTKIRVYVLSGAVLSIAAFFAMKYYINIL